MERAIKLTLNPKHECKMLSFVDFKTQHWFYDEFIYSISCNTGKKMNKLNTIKLGKHTFHQLPPFFLYKSNICKDASHIKAVLMDLKYVAALLENNLKTSCSLIFVVSLV